MRQLDSSISLVGLSVLQSTTVNMEPTHRSVTLCIFQKILLRLTAASMCEGCLTYQTWETKRSHSL